MTTTAAGNIRFGGSGFGPEYITRRKRQVDPQQDERESGQQQGLQQRRHQETEVFLFTVKDPVRSALSQLMSLIRVTLIETPESMESQPEVMSGPLGYTSVRAVRPVAFTPTKTIFRPVTR